MAFVSINFNEVLNCPQGPVSLYEVEVEATGFIGQFAGGSVAGTLLATFSSASASGAFILVNQTGVDIAQFFTGNFPNDIEIDVSNIEENVKIKYRVTTPCGVSDWYENLVEKQAFETKAFVSASPITPDVMSQAGVLINLSGHKVDMDGLKLPLEINQDTLLIEVYSELTAGVVASIEMYVGEDLTDDNEAVSYVTGSNNAWFDGGAGFGEFLDPLILDAPTLLASSLSTVLDKRGWTEANNYIGTDLGSLYEVRVTARDGLSGLLGNQAVGFISKMYGLTIFNIRPVNDDPNPPFDGCTNDAHWSISAIDSYRGVLTGAQTREFINEATLETDLNGAGWVAGSILATTDDAVCMVQDGGVDLSSLRFQYQTPASFPWVEAPPATAYEIHADIDDLGNLQYSHLLLTSYAHLLQNNLSKICNFDTAIDSDSAVRTHTLILLNTFCAAAPLSDPFPAGLIRFQIEYAFLATNVAGSRTVGYTLGAEGWYINYTECLESPGVPVFRREAAQRTLMYHYSF